MHWRTDLFGYSNGHLGTRQRTEGWASGDVTHILRSDIIHGKAHVTGDERHAGRRSRVWMSGANDWISTPRPATSGRVLEPVPSGDPMAAFKRPYAHTAPDDCMTWAGVGSRCASLTCRRAAWSMRSTSRRGNCSSAPTSQRGQAVPPPTR